MHFLLISWPAENSVGKTDLIMKVVSGFLKF
jgi:hypothetical protein